MNYDENNRTDRLDTQSVHPFSINFIKAKALLHSRHFALIIFIIIVIAHFLGYWLWGIVALWNENVYSPNANYMGADYYYGWLFVDLFLKDPSSLYSAPIFTDGPNINNPEFVLYAVAWIGISNRVLGLNFLQIFDVYTFSMFLWNLGNCCLIYKLMNTKKVKDLLGNTFLENPYILMSIFMGTSLSYFGYYIGQSDAIACFFLLLGLYYYIIGKEHFTFLSWSFSLVFRPPLFIFILFFIFHGPMKQFIKNCAFFILAQLPNIVMVIIWPNYIPQFIDQFIVYSNAAFMPRTPANIAEFFLIFYAIPISISEIIIFCCILPITLYVLIEYRKQIHLIDRMMLITLLLFNLAFSYWAIDIIQTLGIYLIWLATKNKKLSNNVRYLKCILALPMLSGLLWLIFPFFSFIFLAALIWLNLLILFPVKNEVAKRVSTL